MSEGFWNGLFDTRWEDAPLGAEAIRLALRLRNAGYYEGTYRTYSQTVVHLGRVLAAEGKVEVHALDEGVIEHFIQFHLPVCRCYHQTPNKQFSWVRRALDHLLAMLRDEGVISPVVPINPLYHDILDEWRRFYREVRGLAEGTLTTYGYYLRDFLASHGDAVSPAELVSLTPDDLLAFCLERGAERGNKAWNLMVRALSSFYCWLEMMGHGGNHLIGVVPSRRQYRLADVPCALTWNEIQRVLDAVDRTAVNGNRNYAMLLMIATYGLRGCEARALRLENIDWPRDEIAIFAPKTGRTRRLPLTRAVGEALLDYLRHERPPSRYREVFVSKRPPCMPLRSNINRWFANCLRKAGIEVSRGGVHILRHSLAVHLLRGGESLKSIGDVLGHRHQDTTFVYTKLQTDDLRTVALEPEVVS